MRWAIALLAIIGDLVDIERYNAQRRNAAPQAQATQAQRSSAAVAERITPACKMIVGLASDPRAWRADMNCAVDFDKKTANGYPVTITDDRIQFRVGELTHIPNRLTGSVAWMSDVDVVGNGECVKAMQRQF